MTGGLIQIASYGIQDIFLIGNPQITFFKTVYKRYCNFAMEYQVESFNSDTNFGDEFSIVLSKSGDLLHRMYLQINIPQVLINKQQYGLPDTNNNLFYTQFLSSYNSIITFINIVNYYLIQPLYNFIKITNFKYSEINQKYKTLYNKMNYVNILSKINQIQITFNKTFRIPLLLLPSTDTNTYIIPFNTSILISNILDFNSYFIYYINSNTITLYDDITYLLFNYTEQLKLIKQNLNNQLIAYTNINNIILRENINFAWVENLGHQIINRIEIEIGGQLIDFTDSIRMNIHHQLTSKIMHEQTYNILLGNIKQLTNFNSTIKPSYTLYIPIDFWHAKYSGLSIPLIYLRYHDVKINIKLNSLVNCCYYEQLKPDILIENIIKIDSVNLILNYIYLDTDERKKFAQLTHEYLIDQTQIIHYKNITTLSTNFEIPFYNPIKQLFWIIRDNKNIQRLKYFEYSGSYYVDIYQFNIVGSYSNALSRFKQNIVQIETTEMNLSNYLMIGDKIMIKNSIYYNGNYIILSIDKQYLYISYYYHVSETYYHNYQIIDNNYVQNQYYNGNTQAYIYKYNDINPISTSTLQLNSVSIFDTRVALYNNFVQPYQHNSKSPTIGLNSYSFALIPEDHQPSGFCNFNKLDLVQMLLVFNSLYTNATNKKSIDILIYAHSYNILQFAYGKAKVIFNL